jgi:hypothetical protein
MERITKIHGIQWEHVHFSGLDFETMVARFGEPHDRDDDGLCLIPEPSFEWLFRWPCGLEVSVIFGRMSGRVFINSDLPESAHVLRHLDLPGKVEWRLDEAPEHFETYLGTARNVLERCRPESETPDHVISNLRDCAAWDFSARWRVMRQDDNEFRDTVAIVNGERDARCLQAELESHGHKQMYWVERAEPSVPI